MSITKKAVTSLTLDLSMPDVQAGFTCTMGDRARRLEILVTDGGKPFAIPPTWSAILSGTKPDGTELVNGCVVQNGKIIYDFESGDQIATCAGGFAVTVWFMDDEGDPVATPKFWLTVVDSGIQKILNEIESTDQFTFLQELVGMLNSLIDVGKQVVVSGVIVPKKDFSQEVTSYDVPLEIDDGDVVLLLPGNEAAKDEVARLEITVGVESDEDEKKILRLYKSAESIPEGNLSLIAVRLKDDNGLTPRAAMIGFGAPSSVSSEDLDSLRTEFETAIEEAREEVGAAIDDVNSALGDIDSALDSILDIQNSLIGGVDSPLPIEVATEEEMTDLLETEEVGSVFKYTGETTDTYTKGELYIVEEVTE